MSGFMSDKFLVLLLPLVAVAALVLALRRRPRGVTPGGEPGCGACGYNTRGLTTLTCPECGSDLRAVGIASRRDAKGRGGAATLLLGGAVVSLLVLGLVGVLPDALSKIVPRPRTYDRNVSATPRSDPARTYDVSARFETWGAVPRGLVVTLKTRPAPPSRGEMTFDAATGGYDFVDADGTRVRAASGFGPEPVAQWLAAAGVDPTNPPVAIEAARLAGVARVVGRVPPAGVEDAIGGRGWSRTGGAGPFVRISSRSSNYTPPPRAARYPVLGGLAACWIALLAALRRATS